MTQETKFDWRYNEHFEHFHCSVDGVTLLIEDVGSAWLPSILKDGDCVAELEINHNLVTKQVQQAVEEKYIELKQSGNI